MVNLKRFTLWSVAIALTITTILPNSLKLSFIDAVVAPAYAASTLEPFANENLKVAQANEAVSFVSPVFTVSSFYAAQITWDQANFDDGQVQFFVRASENDTWEPMEQDTDAGTGISVPVAIGPVTHVQVRADLKAKINSFSIAGVQLTLVDPGNQSIDTPNAFADETVITRKGWGADESLRLFATRNKIRTEQGKNTALPEPVATAKPSTTDKPTTPKTDAPKTSDASEYGPNCSILEAKYPQEVKVSNVIKSNPQGDAYTWPIAYTTKLRKIVVHHTDMPIKDYDQNGTVDEQDYAAAVRSIYYFHTISRDWGDIGYNYLIDPAGHIYEGRAGGDLAIGAHSLCKNNGSLGVALLGQFSDTLPTEAALISLQSLIKQKGAEYNIDINASSLFYGSLIPNVVGHRDIRSTDCPGDRLYELLPQLRAGTLTNTTNIRFATTSTEVYTPIIPIAPPPAVPTIATTKKVYQSSPLLTEQTVPAIPGEVVSINVQFKNMGNTVWSADTMLRPTFLPTGFTLLKQTKQNEELVSPGSIASFLPQLLVDKSLAKSRADIEFYVVPNGSIDLAQYTTKVHVTVAEKPISDDISLNGVPKNNVGDILRKNLVAAQLMRSTDNLSRFIVQDIGGSPMPEQEQPDPLHLIRVKLSMPESSSVAVANSAYNFIVDNAIAYSGSANEKVIVTTDSEGLIAKVGNKTFHGKVISVAPQGNDPMVTLSNFNHAPDWNPSLNDNVYRGVIEWRVLNSKLVTINELPLEDYLKGIGEVSNSAPVEKQKVMAIIARSYALYYLTRDQKFPGMPYDLDDDPNISQKYLGYGYEKRSPAFVQSVKDTEGQVVTYNGEVIKTPYFNKSDGRTRSAKEVWGWDNTPYLVSVPDPLCVNPEHEVLGHGVGLSGCGAEEAARRGYTAEHILGYYYPGTVVARL